MSGSGRPVRRPGPVRVLYLFIGFVSGALISTIIQNFSDTQLEAYHGNHALHFAGTMDDPATASAAGRTCALPPRCGTLNYATEDPITARSAVVPTTKPPPHAYGMTAWHFRDLVLELAKNGTATRFSVTEPCFEGFDAEETSVMKDIPSSLVAQLQPRSEKKTCKTLDDNYIIISDTLGRSVHNLFDELSTIWYHYWLIRRATCGGDSSQFSGRWRITHLNDILNDQPPRFPRRLEFIARTADAGVSFPGVLGVLGKYVPWAEVVKEAKGRCVRLRRAVTVGSSWLWLDRPLPAQASPPLQEFVNAVLQDLGLSHPREGRCKHTLLYATRRKAVARRVLNEEAMLHAMRAALPDFTVKDVDLGTLPFEKQVEAVRGADVYVFPHGGAGPNVLWLPHGAVVIELFPHADADPMYRNLAVQTGKSYLSWQAPEFAAPFDWKKIGTKRSRDIYHFGEASDFNVDLKALQQLLLAAAVTVRNTVGTNWFVSNASSSAPYSAFLCTVCPDSGRRHTCH